MKDSETIMEDLRNSKESAIRDLFDLLYTPLLYFASQYTKEIESAEEIVSDSFMKLWNKRDDFSDYQQLKSFLYIITKNACLNSLRNTKRLPEIQDMESLDCSLTQDTDILEKIILTEFLELMYAMVMKLPEMQRNVFQLSFFEDLTADDIGERLGISLQAVYTNKSRAIAFLKNKLKARYLLILFFLEDFLQ